MSHTSVDVITMGCSKNLVDTERLMRIFENAGISVRHNPDCVCADYVVINTCGFIGDAKEESIEMILECCRAKAAGDVKGVYVMGCLSQRYAKELPTEIPEVDGWYGKFDWYAIAGDIAEREMCLSEPSSTADLKPWSRCLTTPHYQAYVKIAEGCNRFCAFCAIPLITGRYKSRYVEEITDEIRDLVAGGVKEFNIIAQDLTYYGRDIYGKPEIARLVDSIAKVEGVEWIRLHYAYPHEFPMDLLDVMAKHDNVCKYLDIALQHCSDKVLSNMRRHITADDQKALLDKIRRAVPGIHIRTTLMVGFPGEGEEEFAELLEFARTQRFERMGAFAYCEEEDTYAAKNLPDTIPEEVKQARLDKLMAVQEEIALESNLQKVGKTFKVIIDSENERYYIGRTQYDSPEVDPEVLVAKDRKLKPGDFCRVEITQALPYELIGKIVSND